MTGAENIELEGSFPPPLTDEELRALALPNGDGQRNGKPAGVSFELIDLRTLKVKAVKWLEKPFLARGELHILQGHGSAGKGALTCLWAAELSRKGERCLMVVAEDDYEAQMKPRLIAAGADFECVHILRVNRSGQEDALSIPADLAELERFIIEHKIAFVTIDPLLTHIHSGTDSYKDHEVKRVLTPLSKLAQRTGCTVVGVHHFKKDTSQGAKFSGQGSTAFYTTARITMSMAKTEDESHILEVSKSNIGPEGEGIAFQVRIVEVPADDGDIAEVPLLERDGEATQTVDEVHAAPRRQSKSAEARELILEALEDGAVESDTLDAQIAQQTGLAARTIRNVRKELSSEGFIRSTPERGDGAVKRWLVSRTNAT